MSESVRKVYSDGLMYVEEIRKIYGKCERDVEIDVGVLKEWLRKQKHLPQDIEDAVLERFLLRNKFRMEITKQKLDTHYTQKGSSADYISRADPLSEEIISVSKSVIYTHLPKLGLEKERISIVRFTSLDHLFSLEAVTFLAFFNFEVQLRHDYAAAERLILDFENFGWTQFKTVTPSLVIQAVTLLQEGYSIRVAGLDFLHPPAIIEAILKLCKMALKPKIFSKITIHDNLESLHAKVPKECLPKEYGGYLDSIVNIYENSKNMWRSERDWILASLRKTSNEALRIGESRHVDVNMFGVDGTFKKLQVD